MIFFINRLFLSAKVKHRQFIDDLREILENFRKSRDFFLEIRNEKQNVLGNIFVINHEEILD